MSLTTGLHRIAQAKPREALVIQFCPRCHGSMMLEFDFKAGYYRSCINCGYIKYLYRPVLKSDQR